MNNYQAAAAGFGPPASPHAAGGRAGFPAASSPGPALDVYGSAADSVGYVQAASPQPSGFPAIAVSRAPLNYTPGPLIPAAFTNGYHWRHHSTNNNRGERRDGAQWAHRTPRPPQRLLSSFSVQRFSSNPSCLPRVTPRTGLHPYISNFPEPLPTRICNRRTRSLL